MTKCGSVVSVEVDVHRNISGDPCVTVIRVINQSNWRILASFLLLQYSTYYSTVPWRVPLILEKYFQKASFFPLLRSPFCEFTVDLAADFLLLEATQTTSVCRQVGDAARKNILPLMKGKQRSIRQIR